MAKAWKQKSLVLLLFVIGMGSSCLAQDSNGVVSDAEVAAAIQTLKSDKPLSHTRDGFGSTNKVQYQQLLSVYNVQMNAISMLGKAKHPGTAALLIPYLDYSTPEFRVTLVLDVPEAFILKVWPATKALTEIPGSSQALSDYALNQRNPIDYRFAAFQALRFVDKNELKVVGSALSGEFSNSKKALAIVQYTENDKWHFLYIGTDAFHDISK